MGTASTSFSRIGRDSWDNPPRRTPLPPPTLPVGPLPVDPTFRENPGVATKLPLSPLLSPFPSRYAPFASPRASRDPERQSWI